MEKSIGTWLLPNIFQFVLTLFGFDFFIMILYKQNNTLHFFTIGLYSGRTQIFLVSSNHQFKNASSNYEHIAKALKNNN